MVFKQHPFKMRGITFVALLCVLAQAAHAAPSEKVDCSKLDEVMEDLGSAQGLTTLNEKYPIATTAEAQSKRCVEMNDAIKTLRRYNKECHTSLTQQVVSAILRTRSQFNEARCTDPASADFITGLDAAKCAAEMAFDNVKQAETKVILSFQVLHEASIPDDKLRVRRACCAVLEAKKFFFEATKDKCSKHDKVYADYVDSYTNEAMGLICPSVDKLDCAKLEAIKIEGVAPKTKFFLTPMVKLIKTLDH